MTRRRWLILALAVVAAVFLVSQRAWPPVRTKVVLPRIPQNNPYMQLTLLYEDFAALVVRHQDRPSVGVAAARDFVAGMLPQANELARKIARTESMSQTRQQTREVMRIEERIRQAQARVVELAKSHYGAQGAELVMLMADLANAQ